VLVGTYSTPSIGKDIISVVWSGWHCFFINAVLDPASQKTRLVRSVQRQHNVRLLGPTASVFVGPSKGVIRLVGVNAAMAVEGWRWCPNLGTVCQCLSRLGGHGKALALSSGVASKTKKNKKIEKGHTCRRVPSQVLDYLSTDFDSQASLMYLPKNRSTTRSFSSLRATGRSKPVPWWQNTLSAPHERVLELRPWAERGCCACVVRFKWHWLLTASVMTNARRVKDRITINYRQLGAGPGWLAHNDAIVARYRLTQSTRRLRDKLESTMGRTRWYLALHHVWAVRNGLVYDLARMPLVAKKRRGAAYLEPNRFDWY